MKLEAALRKHAAAKRSLRAAGETVDQAIRSERDAGRTIPELMRLTGLSYRGVYLALNRTDERKNGKQ
jgi:Mor family transcriptional regulator